MKIFIVWKSLLDWSWPFCSKLHYKRNLHAGRLNTRRKVYCRSLTVCWAYVDACTSFHLLIRRLPYTYIYIYIYAKAIRLFKVIRVDGAWTSGPFRRKVHLHFCAASIWIYPFIRGWLSMQKGSLAVCARRYKDVWMNMHVFRSRVW